MLHLKTKTKYIAAAFIIAAVLYIIIKLKGVLSMAVIYAALIIKGKKTISQVPVIIRDDVKQILIDLELPELAQEQ